MHAVETTLTGFCEVVYCLELTKFKKKTHKNTKKTTKKQTNKKTNKGVMATPTSRMTYKLVISELRHAEMDIRQYSLYKECRQGPACTFAHSDHGSVGLKDRPRWLSWMRVRLETRKSRVRPRRGRQHSFVEIDHEIFSTVILSLPLIQEGQLSISGERKCTILVNRLEDKACPVNVWIGKLTALDMTPLSWLGRKTSTQNKDTCRP